MRTILKLENAAIAVAGLVIYHLSGSSWLLFAALILVPDISMAAYLTGPRIGAICYNIAHVWFGPVVVIVVALLLDLPLVLSIGLIWAVHIAIDRALGYGLKHYSDFKQTHLGRIGGTK